MKDNLLQNQPKAYSLINEATKASGFSMASDIDACSLLRTLAGTKSAGRLLELGTGTGLSTSWILDGMDASSSLISVDNDGSVLDIAKQFLGADTRLRLVESDGEQWISANKDLKFDFIFADTWHGKYLMLDEALQMLNDGGLYIIDDMLPQPNWPAGHDEKARSLLELLEGRSDLFITKLNWSTGIVVAVKRRKH